ncbi:MAG: lipocalin family protein [Sphingobacteriales bacterium]|nr:lipocalin family protein [Sphingobacteriales bacterium]
MKKLFAVSLIFFAFASCKKDKNETCTLSQTSLAGSYKMTAIKYKSSAASPEQDFFNDTFIEACDRDNVITFAAAGTYTITDAGTVCTPDSNDSGVWTLAGTTISVDGDPGTVESFTCNSFKAKTTDIFVAGDALVITYTRQ